jgi:hypothetical protein
MEQKKHHTTTRMQLEKFMSDKTTGRAANKNFFCFLRQGRVAVCLWALARGVQIGEPATTLGWPGAD